MRPITNAIIDTHFQSPREEYANITRAIEEYFRTASGDARSEWRVIWTENAPGGLAATDHSTRTVCINPRWLNVAPPVPGAQIDRIAALAAHESGHVVIRKRAPTLMHWIAGSRLRHAIQNLITDMQIDGPPMARHNRTFGKLTQRLREYMKADPNNGLAAIQAEWASDRPLSGEALVSVWALARIYGHKLDRTKRPELAEAIAIMDRAGTKVQNATLGDDTILTNAARRIYQAMNRAPSSPPPPPPPPPPTPETDEDETPEAPQDAPETPEAPEPDTDTDEDETDAPSPSDEPETDTDEDAEDETDEDAQGGEDDRDGEDGSETDADPDEDGDAGEDAGEDADGDAEGEDGDEDGDGDAEGGSGESHADADPGEDGDGAGAGERPDEPAEPIAPHEACLDADAPELDAETLEALKGLADAINAQLEAAAMVRAGKALEREYADPRTVQRIRTAYGRLADDPARKTHEDRGRIDRHRIAYHKIADNIWTAPADATLEGTLVVMLDVSSSTIGSNGLIRRIGISAYSAAKNSGLAPYVVAYSYNPRTVATPHGIAPEYERETISAGGTNTGQALAAVRYEIKRRGTGLIVHVTDGDPQDKASTAYNMDALRAEGWKIVQVAVGGARTDLWSEHVDAIETARTYQEVAPIMERLIARTLGRKAR